MNKVNIKEYICLQVVIDNGKRHEKGETIKLGYIKAQPLIELGAIELIIK